MKKRYWQHRISWHGEIAYPLIDINILSYGFSDFTDDINFITYNWNDFESAFKNSWGNLPRNRHMLWQFLHEIKKGDWILIPIYGGNFSIYEIVGEKPYQVNDLKIDKLKDWNGNTIFKGQDNKLYRKEQEQNILIDLGFFWDVKEIARKISRNDYADSEMTSRMKFRGTNVEITDLKENIEIAFKNFQEKKPINIYGNFLDNAATNLNELILKILNPDKFEKLIQLYFLRLGAKAVIPPKNTKDKFGDVDIIAVFENIKVIIYVQAKLHIGNTSDNAVSQIKEFKENSVIDDDYHRIGWVISTGNFSEQSNQIAIASNIRLINGITFSKMIIDAGIENLNEL